MSPCPLLLTPSLLCSQALIAHQNEVHAIDATCYHMGGPLLHADIEDYGSFGACVVCPWHSYPISLRTGESVYHNLSGATCSKGLKQRVHEVVRRDGRILVRLASSPEKVESDTYAFKTPPPSGGGGICGGGSSGSSGSSGGDTAPQRLRSGQFLRAGAAGTRGLPFKRGGAAGDVMKSMSGADGRAPWARSSLVSDSQLSVGFQLGGRKAAATIQRVPAGGAADAVTSLTVSPELAASDGERGWSRHVIHSRAEVGRRCVRLTLRGNLPAASAGGWTCGSHAMVRLVGGEGGERPYTPYERAHERADVSAAGSFELVVKAYPEGALSPRIAALQPGDALLLHGPIAGAAQLRSGVRAIGFVAGGTGVTPMLQIIYSLVRSMHARMPRLTLLCFNRHEEDILVADELAELSGAHPELSVFHSLTEPPASWSGGRGHPSKEILQVQLPPPAPDVQVFWCGPPAFNSTVRELLAELGYTDDMVHEFS